eukprot:1306085-Rhodomonas_salina.1
MVGGWSNPQPGKRVYSEPKFSYAYVGEGGKKPSVVEVDVCTISSSSEREDENDGNRNTKHFNVDRSCDGDLDEDHGCVPIRICGTRDGESGADDDAGANMEHAPLEEEQQHPGGPAHRSDDQEDETGGARMDEDIRRSDNAWGRLESERQAREAGMKEVMRGGADGRGMEGGENGGRSRGGEREERNTKGGGRVGMLDGEEMVVSSTEDISSSESAAEPPTDEEMAHDQILFVH